MGRELTIWQGDEVMIVRHDIPLDPSQEFLIDSEVSLQAEEGMDILKIALHENMLYLWAVTYSQKNRAKTIKHIFRFIGTGIPTRPDRSMQFVDTVFRARGGKSTEVYHVWRVLDRE